MNCPLVTCLCCTFGRPVLLGEAVKCFLDQDYSNKELIVLNDQEGVELFMENCPSNVKIINHPKRFNSLGEKRNYIKTLGNGDFFAIWDDDDLYTPYRLSESVYWMKRDPQYDMVKARNAFLSVDNKNYVVANNLFHSQAMISKKYMQNKQYPNKSTGEDIGFETGSRINSVSIFPSFWYVYRWGLGIHHVSGISDDKKTWEKSLTFEPYKMSGKVEVKAEFKHNYWKDLANVFEKINPSWAIEWEKKMYNFI